MKTPRLKHVVIISGVLILALSLFWFIRAQLIKKVPEGLLVASGRIEGREVTISPKIQGRLHLNMGTLPILLVGNIFPGETHCYEWKSLIL